MPPFPTHGHALLLPDLTLKEKELTLNPNISYLIEREIYGCCCGPCTDGDCLVDKIMNYVENRKGWALQQKRQSSENKTVWHGTAVQNSRYRGAKQDVIVVRGQTRGWKQDTE